MESSHESIDNPDGSCFQEVGESINLKITNYVYGLLDPKRKPMSNSSESVQSAYEVTEEFESRCTSSTIEDTVSEYFSAAGSSFLDPPEMFKSSNSFPSMDSLPSITESSEANNDSTMSGSYSILTESDREHNGMPDILKSVKSRIDKLSKSLDNLQDSPKQTFVPLGAAQSTPIKKSMDICYPKSLIEQTLAFRPLKQRAPSGITAKIVHDIVLEKYEHPYKKIMQKLRKLKFTVEEQRYSQVISELEETFSLKKKIKDKNSSSTDSGLDSDEMNKSLEKDHGFYKQFVAEVNVPVTQVYACTVEHQGTSTDNQQPNEDSSDYDERTFLRNAIGDEILRTEASENYFYTQTASVNTAEISELISSQSTITSCRDHARKQRRSTNSISTHSYASSPILESSTTATGNSQYISSTPELVNEPFRYSYASYEDITNLGMEIYTDEGKKQIKKHIYINEHIIGQTEKMLKYGVKTGKFVGSLAHLEGERILLVSKTRRQVLINHLYRIPEPMNEAVARVTIEKLKCVLHSSQETTSKQQYFVCILQHKTTVYSTKIAAANNQGLVELGGFFIFENVSNTFNIKIQLYSITLPKITKGCLLLPFLRGNRKVPLMELVGEIPIGMLNIKNKKFTFKNSENNKNNEHKLLASIEASVVWPEALRGFMTVGTGKIDQYPIWNKRWCVMEEGVLKYYNYPSDERFNTPIGTVDLKLCKSVDDDTVKYMGQKTLRLFIEEENNFKRVFLSPDNDYDSWSKNLDIILKLNNQWNNSKN